MMFMGRYDPIFPHCDNNSLICGCAKPQKDCRPNRCCIEHDDHALRVPVFGCRGCCDSCCLPPAAPPVTIVNPWNPCEKAVVILSVDECGNLVVRVRR